MEVETLAQLLQEAEEQHGEYEANAPPHHWSTWYAAYIVARDQEKSAVEAVGDATTHTERTQGDAT